MKEYLSDKLDFSLENDMVRYVPRADNIDIPGIAFPTNTEIVDYHYIKVWEVNGEGIIQFDKEKLLRVTPSFLRKIKDLVEKTYD